MQLLHCAAFRVQALLALQIRLQESDVEVQRLLAEKRSAEEEARRLENAALKLASVVTPASVRDFQERLDTAREDASQAEATLGEAQDQQRHREEAFGLLPARTAVEGL